MSDARPRRITLGRLKAGGNAAALADKLRERILAGNFGEGAVLPPERDIVDLTGLGRGSVREALRTLDAEGLIRTKPGRNGGTFTTLPDGNDLTRFVSVFVRGRRVPTPALVEARFTVAPTLASYAALRRDDADIALLHAAMKRLEDAPDGPPFVRADCAWHDAVAAAAHNDLLAALLGAICSALAQQRTDAVGADDAAFAEHRAVVAAIVARDAKTARRRMERLLEAEDAAAG